MVTGIFLTLSLTTFILLSHFPSNQDHPIDLNDDTVTRIAIIDSGCSSDQSFVEVFKNFVTVDNNYLYGEIQPYDTVGHGEFVCDLIHQYAPKMRIFSAKIASATGEITFKGFYEAIKWAAETVRAHVINISIGTLPILSPELQDIITSYVEDQGIVFSVSAGNDGTVSSDSTGLGEWPAILPSTVGVGAVNLQNNKSYSFSSWGRNIYGVYTVDFAADGSPPARKILRGTSFSTPIITGHISNYREFLIEHNIQPSPRLIQGLMVQYSEGFQKDRFDEKIGWGQVRDILKNPLPSDWDTFLNSTFIFGGNHDTIPRFKGENFTVSWKVVTTTVDSNTVPKFHLSGNASSFTTLSMPPVESWGGILNANLEVPKNASDGLYELHIQPEKGNNVTYSFEISGEIQKTVLLDNSLSVNGLNFEYGQLWELTIGLRINGFLPKFSQSTLSDVELQTFDAVVLLQPGSTSEGDSSTVFDNYDQERFSFYIKYVNNGGRLFALLDSSIDPNLTSINTELEGLNITLDRKFADENSPMVVSDLESHPITEGLSSIVANGFGIETVSPNFIEFGHVTYTVTDFFGSYTVTSSVGIVGEINGGKLIMFSGYQSLTNEKISSPTELGTGTYRLFINSIIWLTS